LDTLSTNIGGAGKLFLFAIPTYSLLFNTVVKSAARQRLGFASCRFPKKKSVSSPRASGVRFAESLAHKLGKWRGQLK
jgi:hypothetical protein